MEMNIHNTVGNHIIDLSSFYKKKTSRGKPSYIK